MTKDPWEDAKSIRFSREQWEYMERQRLLRGLKFSGAVHRAVDIAMELDGDLAVKKRREKELIEELVRVRAEIDAEDSEIVKQLREERERRELEKVKAENPTEEEEFEKKKTSFMKTRNSQYFGKTHQISWLTSHRDWDKDKAERFLEYVGWTEGGDPEA